MSLQLLNSYVLSGSTFPAGWTSNHSGTSAYSVSGGLLVGSAALTINPLASALMPETVLNGQIQVYFHGTGLNHIRVFAKYYATYPSYGETCYYSDIGGDAFNKFFNGGTVFGGAAHGSQSQFINFFDTTKDYVYTYSVQELSPGTNTITATLALVAIPQRFLRPKLGPTTRSQTRAVEVLGSLVCRPIRPAAFIVWTLFNTLRCLQ